VSGPPNFQEKTPEQMMREQRRGVLVLDTRPAEQFASFHLAGSMQLGLVGPFASWAAILVEPTQEMLLVAENASSAEEARHRLARVGLERVIGFARADEESWSGLGFPIVSLSTQFSEDVSRHLQEGDPLQLIDVRSPAEWLKGHLPGAACVPLLDLRWEAPMIDFSRPALLYCNEGYRATTAASILLRDHSAEIGIMIDGIEGWCANGHPLEMPQLAAK
jgi:rhodanese-related sulfurtransferase